MGKNKKKKRIKTENGGLVYSTNDNVMNSLFDNLEKIVDENKNFNKDKFVVKLRIEKKSRGGKTVTILNCENKNDGIIKNLLSEIKKHFATGGSIKNDEIIIQGNLIDKIRDYLKQKGFTVKG